MVIALIEPRAFLLKTINAPTIRIRIVKKGKLEEGVNIVLIETP
jgi:hypothetical protein